MSLTCAVLAVFLALTLSSHVVRAQDFVSLCGQSSAHNFTEASFSFNNNAWGNDSSGYQCLDIRDGGNSFTVTYLWTGTPTLVKSYPYMKPHPSRLPVQLWNISRLDFVADWSILVTDVPTDAQPAAYDEIGLRTNVAVDMFLSDDAFNSTQLGPPIEIMIWPWFTPTVKPLGWAESRPDLDVVEIDGTPFRLYHGWNDRRQHVFSWLADRNLTSTNADYSPLLKYIWQNGLLSGALYVGQLEFGTEILHAGQETVFQASNYELHLVRQGDPDDIPTTTSSAPATSSTPTPTSSSTSVPALTSATPTLTPTPSSGASRGTIESSFFYALLYGMASLVLGA